MNDDDTQPDRPMLAAFLAAAAEREVALKLGDDPAVALIRAIKGIPYGRQEKPRAETTLTEWRGCSRSKHYLLLSLLAEVGVEAWVMHRRARLTPDSARALLGERAAAVVPAEGMEVVHTLLSIERDGEWRPLDATLPGPWDGSFPMPVVCGPGEDYTVPRDKDPELLLSGLHHMFCDSDATEALMLALEEIHGESSA